MLPLCSFSCGHNEISEKFQKSNRIRPVVDHECRQCLCSVQVDISALRNRQIDIQTVSLQYCKLTVAVWLRGDNDRGIPSPKSSPDELCQIAKQPLIIGIKADRMGTDVFIQESARGCDCTEMSVSTLRPGK